MISRLFSTLILSIAFAASAFGDGLYLTNQYLKDQTITDICEWKNDVWVSTEKGLYKISDGQTREIPISLSENDQITSLYASSSYTLVCGTFQGNVIFVTEDRQDYCHAEWNLKDEIDQESFYVENVMQTDAGIWLGTIENGVYLYDPQTHTFLNFPLDFNDDSLGLNVNGLATTNGNVTWANAQDGLYFILHIFGKEDTLQYVKSNKIREKPFDIDFKGDLAYVAHRKKSRNYLSLVKLGMDRFDVRRLKKTLLPDGEILGVEVKSIDDFWVLGPSSLTHKINEQFDEYFLFDEENEQVQSKKFLKKGESIFVTTFDHGLVEYSTSKPETKAPVVEIENLFSGQPEFGQSLELNMVYFQPGDANLLSISTDQLNELVVLLKDNSKCTLELIGHTAKDGPEQYLVDLSKSRASAVMTYLVDNGIEKNRISIFGKGASQLKIADQPKSPKNRRVEILLHR